MLVMDSTLLNLPSAVKAEERKKSLIPWVRIAASAAVGFSLAQLNSLPSMSPFAASFAAGIPFDYCFSAFIGGTVGYFVSSPWQTALRYTLLLLIILFFRLAVFKRFNAADRLFVCSLLSMCASVSSGIVYYSLTDFSFYSVLVLCVEGVLSMCGTYFFMKTLRTPIMNIGIAKLAAKDTVCVVVCLTVLLMCMSGLTLGGISPARIAASVFVMFIAQYKGIGFSSAAGVLAGAAFGVSPDSRLLFSVYSLCGAVSGVFSTLGQYAVSGAFAFGAAAVCFADGFDSGTVYFLCEAVIAAAAYAVIPSRWVNSVQEAAKKSGLIPDEQAEREVCASLKRASRSVGEVAGIVEKTSERLDRVINPELDKVFSKLQQNVCFGCGQKTECWNRRFGQTASDVMAIAGIKAGKKEKTELEERCERKAFLKKEIGNSYYDFVTSMAAKTKLAEMRGLVSDQFGSVSRLLSEIAVQIGSGRTVDAAKSRAVKTALHDGGVDADSVRYFTGQNGRVTVEAKFLQGGIEADHKKMKSILQLLTGRRFERPEIAITDLLTSVIFEEKAVYRVQTGVSQIAFKNARVCGDSTARLTDMNGNEIALISDGMGTGSRAAVDGVMTATLLEKLLSCGFSFEGALKMVNCALMVKSTDESIATVDGVSVNVYTGRADFYKAGAAVSFIRRGDSVTVIEEPSMPIGIIKEVSPAHASRRLRPGDIILLVSDGVTAGDCGWINDELLAWSTNSMADLASHIASLARLRSDDSTADDITAIAVKVLKN